MFCDDCCFGVDTDIKNYRARYHTQIIFSHECREPTGNKELDDLLISLIYATDEVWRIGITRSFFGKSRYSLYVFEPSISTVESPQYRRLAYETRGITMIVFIKGLLMGLATAQRTMSKHLNSCKSIDIHTVFIAFVKEAALVENKQKN